MISARYNKLSRANTLMMLGLVGSFVLLLFYIMMGYILHQELIGTYAENYHALEAAGFKNIISAPGEHSNRIVLILSVIPMLGIGIVLPIFLKATCIIGSLMNDLRSLINKDV